MCGIAGIWKRNGAAVCAAEIVRMSALIAHRGPDDVGHVLIDSRRAAPPVTFRETIEADDHFDLALANRRLAIIDLSSLGHQPMMIADCTIVYNGEIYNYVELRAELQRRGHSFVSASDTEVLLQAYLEWGVDCLQYLNGMFAFAIWDARQLRLFCARDRLGIKPFYYCLTDHEFIFASEIRSVVPMLSQQPDIHSGLVYDFLSAGRLDHTDETFFNGVVRLPAGAYLVIDPERVELKKYWQVIDHEQCSRPLGQSVEEFRALFQDAIGLQMRSDVMVGCCLSGGLDSTAVVCAAARQSPHRMRTFTARYRDRSMDEWNYVQAVAARVPIDTVAAWAEPHDFWRELPDVLRAQEEPFGGPAVYAQWTLMRTIRANDVRVTLDGQGGDELLCGYAKYFYFSLLDLWREHRIGRLAASMGLAIFNGGQHLLNFSAARRYIPRQLHQTADELLIPGFKQEHVDRVIVRQSGSVRAQQIMDIHTYSLPALLRYEDKNAMAHSVESRVPFLDHRLVELAVGLPTDYKLYGAQAKRVMRLALADLMPQQVLRRRSKLGFGGSFVSWIDQLRPQLEEWLNAKSLPIDRYVRRESVRHQLTQRDPLVFRSLILDKWLDMRGVSS